MSVAATDAGLEQLVGAINFAEAPLGVRSTLLLQEATVCCLPPTSPPFHTPTQLLILITNWEVQSASFDGPVGHSTPRSEQSNQMIGCT